MRSLSVRPKEVARVAYFGVLRSRGGFVLDEVSSALQKTTSAAFSPKHNATRSGPANGSPFRPHDDRSRVDPGKLSSGISSGVVAKTVGERISERRRELGISQRELACDGDSYAYISRLEANQRRASVRAIRKLAIRLGVSAHWLETGRDDPAEELAQLVLAHKDGPVPARATKLAQSILRSR